MILVQIGNAVVAAESIGQDDLFPEKVWITGIEGVVERTFPNFEVTDLSINKDKIGNICHGALRSEESSQTDEQPSLKVVGSTE